MGWIKGQPIKCVPGHHAKRPDNAERNGSAEVRAKVSVGKRGKPRPDLAERNRMTGADLWHRLTDDQRRDKLRLMFAARKPRTPESRARVAVWIKAWFAAMPESEYRERMAKLQAGRATKARGWHQSATIKQRIGIAKRNYWARQDVRERAALIRGWVADYIKTHRYTDIELAVMGELDRLGVAYEAQVQIGRYWADVYLAERRLVIECDGDYWHSRPESAARHRKRDGWFKKNGYRTVRLWERDIKANVQLSVSMALAM